MNNISQSDIDLVGSLAGKPVNTNDHEKLVKVYHKLEYLCRLIEGKGYRYNIRKDPRKQAGTGKFVFQEYQWAKIYPKDLWEDAVDKFAYIVGISDSLHFHLMGVKDYQGKEASLFASKRCWTEIDFTLLDYEQIADEFVLFDKRNRQLFIETGARLGIPKFIQILHSYQMDEIKRLLEYKKQIILQGPPGTGKTRMAKEIAYSFAGLFNYQNIKQAISKLFKEGQALETKEGYAFSIEKIVPQENRLVVLVSSGGKSYSINYKEIENCYNGLAWNDPVSKWNASGNGSYSIVIAKFIFEAFERIEIENTKQVKIIQFHPSYTYEDFVRGIVSKIDEDNQQVIYEAENKVFAQLAKSALDNYQLSQVSAESTLVTPNLTDFIDHIIEEIDEQGKFMISENVYIFYVDDKRFKYKGDNWATHPNGLNMNFSELNKILELNLSTRKQINKESSLNALTRQHATYYQNFNELYRIFKKEKSIQKTKTAQKNYVIIIDEINRANLSSVLGELIYGLEYRNEAVESMYEVGGNNKLVLPPNLYIIGTMNTADRSVGHIDYAIRRRFAFVDVLPKVLTDLKDSKFDEVLFKDVSALFVKDFKTDVDYSLLIGNIERSDYLSMDFNPEDVWLGHSYFIFKDDSEMKIRWRYEIKPILLEYVRDGVLKESAKIAINKILVK